MEILSKDTLALLKILAVKEAINALMDQDVTTERHVQLPSGQVIVIRKL